MVNNIVIVTVLLYLFIAFFVYNHCSSQLAINLNKIEVVGKLYSSIMEGFSSGF